MYPKYEQFLPIILSALAVLILGCWNPPLLQMKTAGNKPTGYPSYMWLSLAVLVVGVLTMWSMKGMKYP